MGQPESKGSVRARRRQNKQHTPAKRWQAQHKKLMKAGEAEVFESRVCVTLSNQSDFWFYALGLDPYILELAVHTYRNDEPPAEYAALLEKVRQLFKVDPIGIRTASIIRMSNKARPSMFEHEGVGTIFLLPSKERN